MHRPTFTNVNWNLNIKKIRAAQGGPLNRGAPCHGIIGILVNPALCGRCILGKKSFVKAKLMLYKAKNLAYCETITKLENRKF